MKIAGDVIGRGGARAARRRVSIAMAQAVAMLFLGVAPAAGDVITSGETSTIDSNPNGIFTVETSAYDFLYVGESNSGELEVNGGSYLVTPYEPYGLLSAVVGDNAGSSGGMTVTGEDSRLAVSGDLTVGNGGGGGLLISEGGTVSAADLLVGGGFYNNGSGTVSVDGPGSILYGGDTMSIGNFGGGVLIVRAGAEADCNFVSVGSFGGSNGDARISSGADLEAGTTFQIGYGGVGTMEVTTGGLVNTGFGTIGGNLEGSDGDGTLLIDGVGSIFTATGGVDIGDGGTGQVTVQNGGTFVLEDFLTLGLNGGTGNLTIDGTGGSSMTGTGLVVGNGGNASVRVINGAQVTLTDFVSVGESDGSGSLTVRDPGSKLETTSALLIGDGEDSGTSSGRVYVENGGLMTIGAFVGVGENGGDGLLQVDGAGSQFTLTGSMTIGGGGSVSAGGNGRVWLSNAGNLTLTDFLSMGRREGTAELDIDAGSTFTGKDAFVADEVGSVGVVDVSGANATWTATHVFIGNRGNGTLTVTDGAKVTALELHIGANEGTDDTLGPYVGMGNVTVGAAPEVDTGGDEPPTDPLPPVPVSTVTMSGPIWVGEWGDGVMEILEGGVVSSAEGLVGANGPSTGTVDVSGHGASWTTYYYLSIGTYGTGNVTVDQGGKIVAGNISEADNPGSSGLLTVGSFFGGGIVNTPSTFEVGKGGDGELVVQFGSIVNANSMVLGELETGEGIVTLFLDSTLTLSGPASADLIVGQYGSGNLTVNTGSIVTADTLQVGVGVNGDAQQSVGEVTIDGADTNGTFAFGITIADQGDGVLTVSNLATVSGMSLMIGKEEGSNGTVTVTGSDSADPANGTLTPNLAQTTLSLFADVSVAAGGTGELDIKDGGLVTSVNGFVGDAGGSGTVDVTGNLSLWVMTGNLTIGGVGKGSVTVEDGGTITVANLEMARVNNGTDGDEADGTLILNGGTVTVTGTTTIGDAGVGSVMSNGTLSTANVVVGNLSTASGTATVEGGTWTAGTLTIGEGGSGAVTVINGKVTTQGVTLGDALNSEGTLNIGDGNGSLSPLMIVSGSVVVGNSGSGNVTINSGDLTASAMTIGSGATGDGTVSVITGAAELQLSGKLTVGGSGSGDLEILGGGHVVAQSVVVGSGTGDGDKVNLQGTMSVFSSITVGASGATGTFSEMSGNVSAATTNVGTASLSPSAIGVGTLTIGPGDFHAGKLTVASGSTVMVQQGGRLLGTGATIGTGHFLSAQVTITGASSTLDMGTGNISVGGFGAADLEVDAGAAVNCTTLTVDVAGKLQGDGGTINGKVVNKGGTVHPGDSPGTLTLAGDYEQDDGVLDVEFTGTDSSQRDLLSIGGNATLTGGTIQFSFLGGYVPKAGDVLPFLSASSAPSFSGLTYGIVGVADGFQFSVTTAGNAMELIALNDAQAAPEPGTALLVGMGVMGLVVRRRRVK